MEILKKKYIFEKSYNSIYINKIKYKLLVMGMQHNG